MNFGVIQCSKAPVWHLTVQGVQVTAQSCTPGQADHTEPGVCSTDDKLTLFLPSSLERSQEASGSKEERWTVFKEE